MMIEAFMNARIADHNSTNPRIRVTMLMIEVSMPSASDKPSTKWLLARLTSWNRPLRASTMKRMAVPRIWPSHSKKPSTCME
ncbi:hypothetical protein D3C76_1532320 [compost metagenome]